MTTWLCGAASASAASACTDVSGSVTLPTAPAGYAYSEAATLQSNCQLTCSQPQLIPSPSSLGTGGVNVRGARLGTASTDPKATSNYRLWDAANILLNASYTSLTWSTSGGLVSSWSGHIQANWAGDGWANTALWVRGNGGCVGCSYINIEGYAAFSFALYYNQDWNYVTGNGDGRYSNCHSTWVWRVGFPGWHTQTWCT